MVMNKSSFEERLFFIDEIIQKKKTINAVAKENGILPGTLSDWLRRYRIHGEDALRPYKKKYHYTEETKISAVNDINHKGASKQSVIRKYNISSKAVLLSWISNYNKRKDLKKTSRGLSNMKSRKPSKQTTVKERIEIVQYTLAHDTNYQAAIETYGVSYQQIYNWLKKYKTSGIKGLQDRLGPNQPIEELTELDQLRLENKQLRDRNQFLEMEQDFTKKLRELRQRYKTSR
ncbi:helix-turn-helix domain-containing protein [Listeria monocytogenes]|nr:helix-turn-helix domain-containing protein [Listeria monocytogenes]EEO7554490.1 helix-turn-helix domain-containing protein [Listeria monocytogenes]EEO9090175.1 helix-turn-helix domain-containing protein [Listeria monocytogenes]